MGHDAYETMRLDETNTLTLVLARYLYFVLSYDHISDGDLA